MREWFERNKNMRLKRGNQRTATWQRYPRNKNIRLRKRNQKPTDGTDWKAPNIRLKRGNQKRPYQPLGARYWPNSGKWNLKRAVVRFTEESCSYNM